MARSMNAKMASLVLLGGVLAVAQAGAQCTDGNACTAIDRCEEGVCVSSPPLTCPDDGDACTAEGCLPSSGECQTVPTDCDDQNPCTSDDCVSPTGCTNPNEPNGTSCDDGNPCTDDQCMGGSCMGTPNTASCDDGNPCTGPDMCAAAVCSGAPITGVCDDGNACTAPGTCTSGFCIPGAPTMCPPSGDPCMPNQCDSDTGQCAVVNLNAVCQAASTACVAQVCVSGTCVPQVAANGTSCSDANLCTENDVCNAGACGGAPFTSREAGAPVLSHWSLAALAAILLAWGTASARLTRRARR